MGQFESSLSSLFKNESNVESLAEQTKFTREEIRAMNEKFKNEYPKGYLTEEEFIKVYCEHATVSSNRTAVSAKLVAKKIFQSLDRSKDGKVDFKELVCLLSISTHGTVEEKLRWVFTVYDINNDGKLSLNEIGSIVRSMQSLNPNEKKMSDKEIKDMFSRCDKNNDGTITVDEFVHASKSTPAFLKLITDNINSATS
ncbi:neurocalcin [Hydra vulgaris]|uniref:Neurocalcin n=1 Tax=Hydra vulgaris TaxID=6087 RepID=A0ABM4BHH4_HYDVU